MVSQEYSEAIAETLDILEHTKKEDVDKIPKKFMEYLKANTSKTYEPNLDYSKRIRDMHLKQRTIGILSIINRKFWCNDEQRKEFDKALKENEIKYQKEIRERYNPDNLFKNRKKKIFESNVEKNNNVAIVKYKKSLFTIIGNWLKSLKKK